MKLARNPGPQRALGLGAILLIGIIAIALSTTAEAIDSASDLKAAPFGRFEVSPRNLSFRRVNLSANPAPETKSFTIRNTGTATLTVSVAEPTCPCMTIVGGAIGNMTLASKMRRVVMVQFAPSMAGDFRPTIAITSDATRGKPEVTVHLKGRATGMIPATQTPTPRATPTPSPTATPTPSGTPTPGASPSSTPTASSGSASIGGVVIGAANPIAGAQVFLYQAGSGGYGTGAGVIGVSGVTGSSGAFTISYNPPASPVYLYAIASGGSVSGSSNSAISMLAALGRSDLLPSSVTINEVTTAASVWSLDQFMDSTGSLIGASSSNAIGLANSFMLVTSADLVDPATGVAPVEQASGIISPTAKLYTLADIIAGCVGSSGAGSAACANLFSAATPPGGAAPVSTLEAAVDIARNPGNNVSELFSLIAPMPPYAPSLSSAPTDWTLALEYTGGGLNMPETIAIDNLGDAWIADYPGAVSELGPAGAALSPSEGFTGGGLSESFGLAIDSNENVWISNQTSSAGVNNGRGNVTELSSNGAVMSGANGYFGGGIFNPVAVAADGLGNVWVANYYDSTLSQITVAGMAESGSGGFSGGGLDFPAAMAIDSMNDVWVADFSGTQISEFGPNGAAMSPSRGYTGAGVNSPQAIAVDQAGNVWIANYYPFTLSEFNSNGAPISRSPGFSGGGLEYPAGLAVDGRGNIWVTNYHGASISEFSGGGAALSPSSGFTGGGLDSPYNPAIDQSGNLWTANYAANSVTEFIGIAAPVKTPLIGPPALP